MKIVYLDGFTLNPGDLDWRELKTIGDFSVYDRTPREEVIPRAQGGEILLVNKVVLDKAVLEALPGLRYVGVTATGTNNVDLDAARARGITVTNVPAYSTRSVAQMAFALLLELTNHAGSYSLGVRDGRWGASPDFCYFDRQIVELAGLIMGIVGYGHIGQEVGKLARAFGMTVLVSTHTPRAPEAGIEFCGLDDLFRRADVISLHCALTPETKGLVNAARLSLMKPSAYLLNLARGPVVDEQALADALKNRKLAGAGLDVLSTEPPRKDNPLLSAPHCIITPHIAWASYAARKRLFDTVVGNLRGFLTGKPVNVVNQA